MKLKNFLSILILLLIILPGFGQKFNTMDSLRGSYNANRSCYDLTHYHLKIKVDPQTRFISGSNRISGTGLSSSRTIQIDLAETFVIRKISTPKGDAKWIRLGNSVIVTLPFKLDRNEKFWIVVTYDGHPHTASNAPWEGGFVWQKDELGVSWIGVACEGDGASLWFPSKDHPADEPDSVLLEYEVPKNLVAVGNGQFVGKKAVNDSTATFRYKVSYPINHYNITFCAAEYNSWTDTLMLPGKQVLNMSFYAIPEDVDNARRQFSQAKKVVHNLSELFGNYPFVRDGYKLVQVPFLGMEHQSCIAYGDKFADNAFGFDFIVMHETGHEWWGNLISASDHADMWIHESFCTYSEALYVEKTQGKVQSINYLIAQKKKIKNKTPIQGPRDVAFNEWKDSDMYYKGSWMLHSLRSVIANDSLWFAWLRGFGGHFGLKPISTSDVTGYASAYFKQDLKAFFGQYLNYKEWPLLQYKVETKEGKTNLLYRWTCEEPTFEYPVDIKIKGRSQRIFPKVDWVQTEIPDEKGSIEPDEQNFLFKMVEMKK